MNEAQAKKLEGVHPDLVKVFHRGAEIALADHGLELVPLEGLRTLKRQKALFVAGSTTTLKSRHLDGHALDVASLVDGEIDWSWPPFYLIAESMKKAAAELSIPVEWGGDWRKFKDGPHWQLPWKEYPSK